MSDDKRRCHYAVIVDTDDGVELTSVLILSTGPKQSKVERGRANEYSSTIRNEDIIDTPEHAIEVYRNKAEAGIRSHEQRIAIIRANLDELDEQSPTWCDLKKEASVD